MTEKHRRLPQPWSPAGGLTKRPYRLRILSADGESPSAGLCQGLNEHPGRPTAPLACCAVFLWSGVRVSPLRG